MHFLESKVGALLLARAFLLSYPMEEGRRTRDHAQEQMKRKGLNLSLF
jgi:hypothetical protein